MSALYFSSGDKSKHTGFPLYLNSILITGRAPGRLYATRNITKSQEMQGEEERRAKKELLRGFHHYPYDGTNRIRFQGLRHEPLSALSKAPPVKHRPISTVFVYLLSRAKHIAAHQRVPTLPADREGNLCHKLYSTPLSNLPKTDL